MIGCGVRRVCIMKDGAMAERLRNDFIVGIFGWNFRLLYTDFIFEIINMKRNEIMIFLVEMLTINYTYFYF